MWIWRDEKLSTVWKIAKPPAFPTNLAGRIEKSGINVITNTDKSDAKVLYNAPQFWLYRKTNHCLVSLKPIGSCAVNSKRESEKQELYFLMPFDLRSPVMASSSFATGAEQEDKRLAPVFSLKTRGWKIPFTIKLGQHTDL